MKNRNQKDIKKTASEMVDKELFLENSSAMLWEHMTFGQLKKFLAARKIEDMENIFLSAISNISRKVVDNKTTNKSYDYDEKLNPSSPKFELEKYKATIAEIGGYKVIQKRLDEKFSKAIQNGYQEASDTGINSIKELAAAVTNSIANKMNENGIIQETMQQIVQTARTALSDITTFIHSDTYKAIKEKMHTISEFMDKHRTELESINENCEEIQDLAPFLQLELEESKGKSGLDNYSLLDILQQGLDKDGKLIESKFQQLIEKAKKRRSEYTTAEITIKEIEHAAEELPRIISNPTDKINYPLDKPNSIIWDLIIKADVTGKMRMQIDTSKKGSNQDSVIYYGINFDELNSSLEITKELTPFDKRCYIAVAALFSAKNSVISATQIYRMMGNTTPPNKTDLQKVNDSLTKMGAAHIYVDNSKEIQSTDGYKYFKYDAALLPFERISAYINGQLVNSAIHLFREPPLISFAKQRNQITTLSRQLLESPLSKTNANLRIDDYLLERIGHMKSEKSNAPCKILFSTIYKQCKITTVKQKQRSLKKIERYLEYYEKCQWIKGHKMEENGIKIIF